MMHISDILYNRKFFGFINGYWLHRKVYGIRLTCLYVNLNLLNLRVPLQLYLTIQLKVVADILKGHLIQITKDIFYQPSY